MIDTRQLTAPHAPFFAALPPVYAAYFRGFAAALLVGVIEAAVHYLQVGPALPAAYEVLVPVAILLLRSAEGYVDHHSTATAAAALAAPAPAPAALDHEQDANAGPAAVATDTAATVNAEPAHAARPIGEVPGYVRAGDVTPVVVKTDTGYHIGAPDATPADAGSTTVVNPS